MSMEKPRVNFANHLAIVYTLIIAIPLIALLFGASEYLRASMYESLSRDSGQVVSSNVKHIGATASSMERLESVITGDYELLRTFYFAGKDDEAAMISFMYGDVRNLERLLFALPEIYGMRIFVSNPNVPERWPIVFAERRIAQERMSRWTWGYRSLVMPNIEGSKEPSVCMSRELLVGRRHVGLLQISVRMADMFPFLYRDPSAFYSDYVFRGDQSLGPEDSRAVAVRDLVRSVSAGRDRLSFPARVDGENLIVSYETVTSLDLLVVHTSSLKAITNSILLLRLSFTAVLLSSIALLFFVIKFATKKMVTRLYAVMRGMQEIRAGNLDVSVRVAGNDEVADMANAFTGMVGRIQDLVGEIERKQSLVVETEIKAMQNQINAHFLYNVLETIKMQAEVHDQPEIAESITLLGRMLRYCLRWRNHRVLLGQELDYVRDYVQLMNIRNDYRISLFIDVDEALLSLEIPKMLVQPVIENAVLHAIEPEGVDGAIDVFVTDAGNGILLIHVRDRGIGMDPETLGRLRSRLDRDVESGDSPGGIGLVNIQQRLRAFYGAGFSLGIASASGEGTEVTIPVPSGGLA